MQPVQLSSVDPISFTSVNETDHQIRLTGTISLSALVVRPDQTVVAGAGSFTEPDAVALPGVRQYVPAASDWSVVGCNVLVIKATGMETREIPVIVTSGDPYAEPGSRWAISFHGIMKGETDAVKTALPFTAVDPADVNIRVDGGALSWTATVLKADGSVETGLGDVVQPSFASAPGVCYYRAAQDDLGVVGPTVIRLAATGAETRELDFFVVPFDPYEPLPTTGFTWSSLIERARVYAGDDHGDNKSSFVALDKWLLFGQVEWANLRRSWIRMGLVRPAMEETTFTGNTVTLVGVEAVAGVARVSGSNKEPLTFRETIWSSPPPGRASTWMATGYGGDLKITVDSQENSTYVVRWVQQVQYTQNPEDRVLVPTGADERLVLGMAKRALVKDSARSTPLEALIAEQDAQIAFSAMAQVRSGPVVLRRNYHQQPSVHVDSPKNWRFF